MQFKKMVLILLLCLSSFVTFPIQAQRDAAFAEVEKFIENLNQHNWSVIPNLWVKDRHAEFVEMISNKENLEKKIGFFNVKSAKLVAWKELPYEYGSNFVSTYILDRYKNIRVFYVAVDYEVHRQDKFRINGVNYFLVVVAKDDNEWKIALTPIVPVKSLITDGYGFGTDEEKTYDERRLQFVD